MAQSYTPEVKRFNVRRTSYRGRLNIHREISEVCGLVD